MAIRLLVGWGFHGSILLAGPVEGVSPELALELDIARRLGVPVICLDGGPGALSTLAGALGGHSVVVDGLFGTGLSRPIEGLEREVVLMVAASGLPVVAVDLPSGVDADSGQVLGAALPASVTVALQHLKPGHVLHPGRALAGQILLADIGIPASLLANFRPPLRLIEEGDVRLAFPARASDTHKGTYGHLLVVAGEPERPGAALLAGRAAIRSGSGLVTLAGTAQTLTSISSALDELMGHALHPPFGSAIVDALSSRSALAIGPSLTPSGALAGAVREVLEAVAVPAVVDAGALFALGPTLGWLRDRRADTVLTPHPGELARMLGVEVSSIQRDRLGAARRLSEMTGAHVVLKGASSVVASPGGAAFVSLVGNACMATAGAGDVLTGIVGALLARGVFGGLAVRAAVHLHGLAGDLASAQRRETLIASDLLRMLPEALAWVAPLGSGLRETGIPGEGQERGGCFGTSLPG